MSPPRFSSPAPSYASSTSRTSASSNLDDEITPAPPRQTTTPSPEPIPEPHRRASTATGSDTESIRHRADDDAQRLWQRMLAVQRVFGCYNSARMSAALDDEELQSRVPSRACLDLLNDGISRLPEEERQQVIYFVEHGKVKPLERRGLWRWSVRRSG